MFIIMCSKIKRIFLPGKIERGTILTSLNSERTPENKAAGFCCYQFSINVNRNYECPKMNDCNLYKNKDLGLVWEGNIVDKYYSVVRSAILGFFAGFFPFLFGQPWMSQEAFLRSVTVVIQKLSVGFNVIFGHQN